MRRILFTISLGWAITTHSMIPETDLSAGSSIPFYRDTKSLFPSGEVGIDELERTKVGDRSELWFSVKNQRGSRWLPENQVLFYRDFYQPSPMEAIAYVIRDSESMRDKKGWFPDKTIKQGLIMSVHQIRSDWSCGSDHRGPLCVPTKNIILGIDTAKRILDDKGQWHEFQERQNHFFMTKKGLKLLYSQIKNWENDSEIGFIKPPKDSSLAHHSLEGDLDIPPYSRVTVLDKKWLHWKQSLLKNHGPVWWMEKTKSELEIPPIILTEEEAHELPLFDKAESKTLSLLSGNGVFLSTDGATWRFLPEFHEQNLPVAINPKGHLIVGDKISLNRGNSFQPYIRWEEVAFMTHQMLGHNPKQLRLVSVHSSDAKIIEFHVETGYKTLVFHFNTITSRLKPQRSYLASRK